MLDNASALAHAVAFSTTFTTRGICARPMNCLIGFSIPFMFTSTQASCGLDLGANLTTEILNLECLTVTTSVFRDSTDRRLRTLILRFSL